MMKQEERRQGVQEDMTDTRQPHEPEEHHGIGLQVRVTRRQFLSYTLGAAGAFMAGGMLIPMIRFAIDPLLKTKATEPFVKVVEVAGIGQEPTAVKFKKLQVDGWVEKDIELTAWIAKDKNGKIFALSPICKHLGCTIDWNTNAQYPNQYFCPCHGAHYTPEGKNLAIASGPLDEYEVKIENGFVYLGGIRKNTIVS